MDLDYRTKGEVKKRIDKYAADTIEEFPELILGSATSLAADHLFEVSKDASELDKPRGRAFHRAVARLLFLCKRARPDLQQAVAFLTKRMSCSTMDDWKKLVRLL